MKKKKTQKLSIRLLKEDKEPKDALRESGSLEDWERIAGAKIARGRVGGGPVKWASFLELSEKDRLKNISPYANLFIPLSERRWFALSFGMGHVKLEKDVFEQNFGLKVVANAVDAEKLKSVDVDTPDENTTKKRIQKSRNSDETAFGLDAERDILLGIAGHPRNPDFAKNLSGKDSLSITREMIVDDLVSMCEEIYEIYKKEDYKENFGWIDNIKYERDKSIIEKLEESLVNSINDAVKNGSCGDIYLAFPEIYDPEKNIELSYYTKKYQRKKYMGRYYDLNIQNYIDEIDKENNLEANFLKNHKIIEWNDLYIKEEREIYKFLSFETEIESEKYVLSVGKWYCIDKNLARGVEKFFDNTKKFYGLPKAQSGENEKEYNERLKKENKDDFLCMDKKLIRPKEAKTNIEICDFMTKNREFIHIKNKVSSSNLSHLFNQGLVSFDNFMNTENRNIIYEKIKQIEKKSGQKGYSETIDIDNIKRGDFTVVYAVITNQNDPHLPFFSLVTFKRTCEQLGKYGCKYAFAWINPEGAMPSVNGDNSDGNVDVA